VHRYGNDPAAGKVVLNLAPGAIAPEFHAPLFAVDVCAVLSLFVQVTVPPAATVTASGANASVVRVDAPLTIETVIPEPVGDGDVDGDIGDEGDEEEPQPNDAPRSAVATTIRRFMVPPSIATTAANVPPSLQCVQGLFIGAKSLEVAHGWVTRIHGVFRRW
jgi:hypothetical protein